VAWRLEALAGPNDGVRVEERSPQLGGFWFRGLRS